ncbi:phage tail fiber C-terminal domain-containing protein [Escherichia coli]|uniref:phage tail fiber C-terminal domain-containing protein n=1 Tax=Escherichia coli TaxID=562 RepID=UPI00202532B8|nr:phage tail fiber C-terminal domain-containing protein [Escherichia coli]
MNILKKLMQRLCGCGKHDGREHGQSLTAQLRLGPADILESDENGIIPEQARVITQVVILDADKKQIQCVVRPLQVRLRFLLSCQGDVCYEAQRKYLSV